MKLINFFFFLKRDLELVQLGMKWAVRAVLEHGCVWAMVKNKHSLQNWVKMRVKQLSGSEVTEGGMQPQGKVVRGWDGHPVECECPPILGAYAQEPGKLPQHGWMGRLGAPGLGGEGIR